MGEEATYELVPISYSPLFKSSWGHGAFGPAHFLAHTAAFLNTDIDVHSCLGLQVSVNFVVRGQGWIAVSDYFGGKWKKTKISSTLLICT